MRKFGRPLDTCNSWSNSGTSGGKKRIIQASFPVTTDKIDCNLVITFFCLKPWNIILLHFQGNPCSLQSFLPNACLPPISFPFSLHCEGIALISSSSHTRPLLVPLVCWIPAIGLCSVILFGMSALRSFTGLSLFVISSQFKTSSVNPSLVWVFLKAHVNYLIYSCLFIAYLPLL